MGRFRCLVAAVLVLGLPMAAAADHHEQTLMQEVAAIGDAMTEAMLAEDVDTLMSVYADDAISLPNNGPRMDGVEAFRKSYAEMKAAGIKITSFNGEPTDVWEAGSQVIEIGTYEITVEMGGMPIEDHGKYVTIWERDADGALKVKVETWNTDVNPLMQAEAGGDHGDHE